MKYFKATIITTVDHENGKTTSHIYLPSETKIAAKKLASQHIFETDGANCCFYKSPRLEEISVEEYLANTEKQTDITEEQEIDQFCALLTIFGIQEEYDEGEMRDADDLLANPSEEPELFEQYTHLRELLSVKIQEADKIISLNEVKEIAINLVDGVQKERLFTQSTELSTESVIIPVENVGEVEKSVTDVALDELVNNCTEEKALINSVINNIDDNSIFSAFPPVNGKIMSGEGISLEMLNGCVDALKPTESLIVRHLANSTYHAANGYSSTQIRLVQKSGLGALDWYKKAPIQGEKTRALLIGDAVHTAILEPELFPLRYVSAPELDLRTKDGKKILSDFEKKNLTLARLVLKKEEFEAIQLMRDSALAYPLVAELLENGEPELSIFYRTEKGTLLKIRPDWLGLYSGVPFILDVKTTDDVHDFGKSVDKFGYHLQAAFYRIIAQKVFNLDIDFLFCAIGKRPECGRYPVQLGMLDEEDSEEGEIQVNGVINALEKGGETQAFAMISRPFWAKQADRKRREALMLEGGVA
ncbi:PD-(D/E)XK nuclease-like domain-containing protein [Arsenophonus nasoniae]|uniref:PD-(D/E)XK nuclease-like domain-containing protein n=1 Tax=Arsenophonus nasoniae TaxID=638 RepID=A0AA95KFH9_9GAMM|nr:PD-(D/E)XK nuclease-like domain-containing protein [Arsenophonus nasoniae]WGM03909.1 PD-(D/E)XK nuclease-like domain-containing protein [Arsenophonus nasoniae]